MTTTTTTTKRTLFCWLPPVQSYLCIGHIPAIHQGSNSSNRGFLPLKLPLKARCTTLSGFCWLRWWRRESDKSDIFPLSAIHSVVHHSKATFVTLSSERGYCDNPCCCDEDDDDDDDDDGVDEEGGGGRSPMRTLRSLSDRSHSHASSAETQLIADKWPHHRDTLMRK